MAGEKQRPGHIVLTLMAVMAILLTTGASQAPEPPSGGQIYLYGELHSDQFMLDMEFELWSAIIALTDIPGRTCPPPRVFDRGLICDLGV